MMLAMLLCMSFAVPAFASGFEDVKSGDFYEGTIRWAVENGITNGVSATKFGKGMDVTRAQAVTFLWRLKGQPAPSGTGESFVDVEKGSWYDQAVQWATENGITNGVGQNKFDPNGSVTRGQMITFLWRAEGMPGGNQGGQWYESAENWAFKNHITDRTINVYKTDAVCPREDVLAYMWNDVIMQDLLSRSDTIHRNNLASLDGQRLAGDTVPFVPDPSVLDIDGNITETDENGIIEETVKEEPAVTPTEQVTPQEQTVTAPKEEKIDFVHRNARFYEVFDNPNIQYARTHEEHERLGLPESPLYTKQYSSNGSFLSSGTDLTYDEVVELVYQQNGGRISRESIRDHNPGWFYGPGCFDNSFVIRDGVLIRGGQ